MNKIRKMWSGLVCRISGHKRGKRAESQLIVGMTVFYCPRCQATWMRKVEVKKPKKEKA